MKLFNSPFIATIKKSCRLLLLFTAITSAPSFAQSYAVDSNEAVNAEELWVACAFCHGPEGQGGPALDAPPLAGMESWYIESQLHAYKNRIRGVHPEDVPGVQMSIVSGMTRNDATVKSIAAYISNMDTNYETELYYGEPITNENRNYVWQSKYAVLDHPNAADAEKGKAIFASNCLTCHSANGEGNVIFRAPKLTLLPDWYIHRQLQYFRDGLRGADPRDLYGAQMAAFTKLLPDDQAIADVTAYILTLQGENNE